MKTNKLMALATAITILVASQAIAGNGSENPNRAGNEGGGGGNGSTREIFSEGDLRQIVDHSKFILRIVFNSIEASAIQEPRNGDYRVFRKLNETKPILKVLKDANISIQAQPCQHQGIDSDAAAILPNFVCVSSERLKARQYSQDEILRQTISLLAHEIAHLAGGNEWEAQFMQDMVESITTARSIYFTVSAILSLEGQLYVSHSESQGTVVGARATCAMVSNHYSRLEGLEKAIAGASEKIVDGPSGLLNIEQMTKITDAKIRYSNVIANYCGVKGGSFNSAAFGQILKESNQSLNMIEVISATNTWRKIQYQRLPINANPVEELTIQCTGRNLISDCLGRDRLHYQSINFWNFLSGNQQVSAEIDKAVASYADVNTAIRTLLLDTRKLLNN